MACKRSAVRSRLPPPQNGNEAFLKRQSIGKHWKKASQESQSCLQCQLSLLTDTKLINKIQAIKKVLIEANQKPVRI